MPSWRSGQASVPKRRVEEEEPEHAGDGGGDGVGPDQQGAVEALAADDLLGLDGEQERDRHREEGGPDSEKTTVTWTELR